MGSEMCIRDRFSLGERVEVGHVDPRPGQANLGLETTLRSNAREVIRPEERAGVFSRVGAAEEDEFSHSTRVDHPG